jgi:endogenous inhibitor of DNA gyrase (YacG/DUF329 family)
MNDLSKWFGESYKVSSNIIEDDEDAATDHHPQSRPAQSGAQESGDDEQ